MTDVTPEDLLIFVSTWSAKRFNLPVEIAEKLSCLFLTSYAFSGKNLLVSAEYDILSILGRSLLGVEEAKRWSKEVHLAVAQWTAARDLPSRVQ